MHTIYFNFDIRKNINGLKTNVLPEIVFTADSNKLIN